MAEGKGTRKSEVFYYELGQERAEPIKHDSVTRASE